MMSLGLKKSLWVLSLWLAASFAMGEEILYLVTGEFAPFSGEALPHGGMTTEITVSAFKEMGYETQIDFLPWKRGYINTRKHLYLGTFPYVEDATRKKTFLFSKPLYTTKTHFFARQNSSLLYENQQDLQGLKVCLPVGYSAREIQGFLDKGIVTIGMRPSNDAACFRALHKGRVDLYAINSITGWAVIKKTFGDTHDFKTIGEPLLPSLYYFIVDNQHPNGQNLLDVFNNGLTAIKKKSIYQNIISRHLGI